MTGNARTITDWKRDRRFARYVELFNRREFFKAHEVLEDLWLQLAGPDRDFLQGLIQLAVALEHDARGNPMGAEKVLRSATRRLAPYGERHAGVRAGELKNRIAAYLAGEEKAPPAFALSAARSAPQASVRSLQSSTRSDLRSNARSEPRSNARSAPMKATR